MDQNKFTINDATLENKELWLSAFKDATNGQFPSATIDGTNDVDVLVYSNGGTYWDLGTTSQAFNPKPPK